MKSLLFSLSRLGITVRFLMGAAASVTVTLVGFEVTLRMLALSESVLARHGGYGLNAGLVGTCLTIVGVLMVFVGVFASPFLSDRTEEPQWLLYVYACPLRAAGFLLLMHWFAVCGATGLRRLISGKGRVEMKVQKKVDWWNLSAHFALLVLAALVFSTAAFGAQGGGALPWEAPLTKLQQSLSGPVAGAIAVIALVAIGVVLVFGGEWNEFARRSVYAVCAIAFIVSAGTLLAGLFQVGAAVV